MTTTTVKTFDSIPEPLPDLLHSIKTGKTQLPDFQRGWVWDDEHIRSLLASVSLSYPIGAVMLLQAGGQDVRFQTRSVEGAPQASTAPDRLILDGQQRLTSLYLALFSGKAVDTRDAHKQSIKRWYYLDIKKALDPLADREEAVVGLPEDRVVRNFRGEPLVDYSTPERERAAEMLPLSLIFDSTALMNWAMQYARPDQEMSKERFARWDDLTREVISRFQVYQVPLIVLKKETPKEAVCQVFEKVNTGGVSLTVFELLTATFAVDNFHLRDDWTKQQSLLRQHAVLRGIENTDFLQAVTLLATFHRRQREILAGKPAEQAPGISCKRKEVLRLSLAEYQAWANATTEGFVRTAKLLHGQKIFAARDVPYRTQLTPLAAILAVLGGLADHAGARYKLTRWYWCGVFGELYGGAIETRFAKDLPEVLRWMDGGEEPDTIRDASFASSRLLSLRTRNSAAYKGLYALLIRDGGDDFRTGVPIDEAKYFDERIDIHHIFPQDWCSKQGLDIKRYDSIVNKTPLSARTNRMIGGNAPSVYVPRITRQSGVDATKMDSMLTSHVIDPAWLRADDFDKFFTTRASALLDRIEGAMGKPVNREAIDMETMPPWTTEEEDEAAG